MSDENSSAFKDHFSGHAAHYADARPGYPAALFADLAAACVAHDRAWDCATGNGQAARSLARHFSEVIATDASAEQIASAAPATGIRYRVAQAENPGLDTASVNLITVAQALHWFDIDRFFAVAEQLLCPGGVLACWSYGTCTVEPACDAVTRAVYEFVDEFWPPERRIVERGYRDIVAPLPVFELPGYDMSVTWDVGQMLAYIGSWSACQRYERARGVSPLRGYEDALREHWGGGRRIVRWPLSLIACRKPGA